MIDALAIAAAALLVAVWLLYPLAIAIAARITRPVRRTETAARPAVSVVIATREDEGVIRARIRNVLETAYPLDLIEVIVARDALGDSPSGERDAPARVVWVEADAPGGKASALNAGVRAARGEVLVFADSHQRFEPDTIPLLVDALGGDRVGAVSGQLEIPQSTVAARYWSYERWLRRNEARVHSTIGVTGAVYAMRRDLWAPLPAGLLLDDVYTPMRIVLSGWRVAFSERALAHETRAPTPRQEYARKVRTLTGVLQLCAWLPELLVPFRNPVWLQFVFHKLLRMLTPYALAVLALWTLFATARLAGSAAPLLAALLLIVALWVARSTMPWAARVRRLATEVALLQWAVVNAGVNGLRGQWGVWDA